MFWNFTFNSELLRFLVFSLLVELVTIILQYIYFIMVICTLNIDSPYCI